MEKKKYNQPEIKVRELQVVPLLDGSDNMSTTEEEKDPGAKRGILYLDEDFE